MKFLHFGCIVLTLSFSSFMNVETANSQSWADGMPNGCKMQFKALNKMQGWKAFSVSKVFQLKIGPRQTCGWSQGFKNKAEAARYAIKGCQEQLQKLKAPKSETCTVRFSSK
jgi:hypothetical protein